MILMKAIQMLMGLCEVRFRAIVSPVGNPLMMNSAP